MPVPTYFRFDGWVKATTGQAVPGAQVYVAQQPANVASAPPSPLQDIFSDPEGLVPITQPILTDGFGHYDFYVTPGTYTVVIALNSVIQQVYEDQTIGLAEAGGSGTVTSVAVASGDGILSISGSPITDAGTITLSFATEPANKVLSGPTTGPNAAPTFRSLVLADLPTISFSNLSGNIAVSQMNSGTGASSSTFWRGDGTWASAGGTTFSTSGQGFFWGGQSIEPINGTNVAFSTDSTANLLQVSQLILYAAFTISKLSVYVAAGTGAGTFFTCGIYSADGNTLLINAGTNAFNTNSTAGLETVTLGSPVTLPAGIYYFACGGTGNNSGNAGAGHSMSGLQVINLNANFNYFGTAANGLSGGALPATLGTITPYTTNDARTIPGVIFQV